MTAMRGAVLVALSILIACGGGEGKGRHGDVTISNVSQSWSSFDSGPIRSVLKLEFTMPKDFPIDSSKPWISMTDASGRHVEAKEMSISTNGDGVVMVQSVSARFELAEDSKPIVLHIGDDYDIDFSSGRVTRRAAPAASTAP